MAAIDGTGTDGSKESTEQQMSGILTDDELNELVPSEFLRHHTPIPTQEVYAPPFAATATEAAEPAMAQERGNNARLYQIDPPRAANAIERDQLSSIKLFKPPLWVCDRTDRPVRVRVA
jgi:hypothetical protein